MRRAVLFALLCVVATVPAPELQAKAYKCILINSKGQCGPLPCEFMAELKFRLAQQAALSRFKGSRQTSVEVWAQYARKVNASLAQAEKEYSACPSADRMPHIEVPLSRCEIVVAGPQGFQPITLEEMLNASQTCSEVVEARFAYANELMSTCPGTSDGISLQRRRQSQLGGLMIQIATLRLHLRRYLSSCAPDAKLAQELTDLGLDALKNEAQQAREAWQASRWQNPAYDPGVTFTPR